VDAQVFIKAIPEIVTQLVAFLLVFLVLKKFAFGAIFKGIEDRQNAIAGQFKDLEDRKKALVALESEYRTKLQHIEQEARDKMQAAIAEGNRIGQDAREKARQDAAREIDRAKAEIQNEVAKARVTLKQQVVNLASQMTAKLVRKNYSSKDDEMLVDEILREAEKA